MGGTLTRVGPAFICFFRDLDPYRSKWIYSMSCRDANVINLSYYLKQLL